MKILKRDMENCGIKGFIFLFFLIILLPMVLSTCEEGQIDINSASLSELDKLSGIGPAKAQAIIDSRTFSSVDDLIKVNGIGNATLEKIKVQGLACISNIQEEEHKEQNALPKKEQINEEKEEQQEKKEAIPEPKKEESENKIERKNSENIIKLNSKKTESEVIYESKNEKIRTYAIYGFCLLLIFIIIILLKK